MIISFDLDDTLIPGMKQFPTERRGIWQKLFSREKIRAGTIELIKALKAKNHRIFIYTTSYRSPAYIRRLFFSYGIFPEKIINKSVHDKTLGKRGAAISKYPPAFNIDVHIDDSPGVAMEGDRHQFNTIIVAEEDLHWGNNILQQIAKKES